MKPKKKEGVVVLADAKSQALVNFEENLDQLMTFVRQMDSGQLQEAGEKVRKAIRKEIEAAPNMNAKRLQRATDTYGESVKNYMEFLLPACRWMSVMLVSFLEAFMEDGLIEVAARNPKMIKSREVQGSLVFETESLDALRGYIRRQWAHDAIRPDGPKTWCRVLRDFGAPPINQATVSSLQHLWDTRNLIVHSRSIADAAYAKKYERLGVVNGSQVKVNIATFGAWLNPVKEFVEWADRQFQVAGGKGDEADGS